MANPVVALDPSDVLPEVSCRHCGGGAGESVLDLGRQPGCEQFPEPGATEPVHPLRMWFCVGCGLAQLADDPGWPENVLSVEPRAMRDQAGRVVERLAVEGRLRRGASVTEFGSPHGGDWLPLVVRHGLVEAPTGRADLVLDTYGLLHEPDQARALAARAARLAPGGVMVFQFHSLATVLLHRQWSELRHGHFGYWSVPALDTALRAHGLGVHRAWRYPMAGGTIVVLAQANADPDVDTRKLISSEVSAGVLNPSSLRALQADADRDARVLRTWLGEQRQAGRRVVGYGAASRAVPVLCHARITRDLLPAVGDASPGKQGRMMPGTDVPVISPAELVGSKPDTVLLMLPDLLDEVRRALPEIEAAGGTWLTLPKILGKSA
ncbi:class I SAM-dependent methyltransferase [Actinokineospora xionganensis]|uniref:Methyltransferase domain-containing protein n=1 Tax=Actinokineospora xionganensis TaxID=2684470 RepID=A0ABR7L1Q1_9PSEU|nr:class I SAM-dependent methyltransferase [Actinokineospora xionganensis]MBC6446609.1 methyltransferase domain-containing protein [Actinokineospora xionganensis]